MNPRRPRNGSWRPRRVHLRPAAIPYWETIEWSEGKIVGIVSLPADAPDKPYKAKRGSAWVTQIRVGTTTRDATDEEEVRLYQQSGRLQYDRKPVPGSSFADLDRRRLSQLLPRCSPAGVSRTRPIRQAGFVSLVNTELMAEDRGRPIASAGGLLLFGTAAEQVLASSGRHRGRLPGNSQGLRGEGADRDSWSAVSLFRRLWLAATESPRTFSETGDAVRVIEQALDFVRRNTTVEAWIDDGGRRQERWDYPLEAVREAVVNAIAHRDYTITVTDIELSIYSDRLEVISPGRLPNTVTVEKMRAGYRASRNELIKEVLRDYRYIEATGLGVPRKIVQGMLAHNGTEPDLIEDEDRFIVRLWKEPKPA